MVIGQWGEVKQLPREIMRLFAPAASGVKKAHAKAQSNQFLKSIVPHLIESTRGR
jgi:hypothetical protein